jgi:UDP-N-acetylmuramyl pentapeptide synthase
VIPLANQLNPGDVVLVKASRAASLEGVAAGLIDVNHVREADR